MTSAAS